MEMNKRIGDYEILSELGSGGMGRVFKVRNVLSDRIEAMKVLLPDLVGREDLAARFLREIKTLAALDHPNIAVLRTALSADNQLVMIMEYVEGQSLASRVAQGPIATADALAYLDQVLDALSYAHAQHVVHRDVKPANMLLTTGGLVKLTDFGIARSRNDQTLTATGTTTGSLSYMSPEQINGEKIDARSDLYSVGISLYEMVTGQRPFESNSDFAVMFAHLKEQPKPPIELQPGLPPGLNDLILRSIAKQPDDRFQTADEFRQALAWLRGIDQTSPRVAATPVQRRSAAAVVPTKRRVHPGVYVALGGLLTIAALAGTGFYLRHAEAGSEETGATGSTPAARPAAPPDTARPDAGDAAGTAPATASEPAPPSSPVANTPSAPPPAAPVTTGSAAVIEVPQATKSPAAIADATAGRPAAGRDATVRVTPASPGSGGSSAGKPAGSGVRGVRGSHAKDPVGDTGATPRSAPAPAKPRQAAEDVAEIDQLEQEIDQLAARAGAVNNSLDRLQREQSRQGLGLRGDMAARQETMKMNLSRAQEAVDKRDAPRARRFRDLTQRDVEALEQFLGR